MVRIVKSCILQNDTTFKIVKAQYLLDWPQFMKYSVLGHVALNSIHEVITVTERCLISEW